MINMQQKTANIAACVKPTARGTGEQPKCHTKLHHGALCAADPAHSVPTGSAAFASSRVFRTHIRLEKMEGENEDSRGRDLHLFPPSPPSPAKQRYAHKVTHRQGGCPPAPSLVRGNPSFTQSYMGRQRGRAPPWKRYFDKGRFS